jgi:hypothetical protein
MEMPMYTKHKLLWDQISRDKSGVDAGVSTLQDRAVTIESRSSTISSIAMFRLVASVGS